MCVFWSADLHVTCIGTLCIPLEVFALAMSAAATTTDPADDLLDNPLWILDCKVPQLKAAWQKLDQSCSEHTSTSGSN